MHDCPLAHAETDQGYGGAFGFGPAAGGSTSRVLSRELAGLKLVCKQHVNFREDGRNRGPESSARGADAVEGSDEARSTRGAKDAEGAGRSDGRLRVERVQEREIAQLKDPLSGTRKVEVLRSQLAIRPAVVEESAPAGAAHAHDAGVASRESDCCPQAC